MALHPAAGRLGSVWRRHRGDAVGHPGMWHLSCRVECVLGWTVALGTVRRRRTAWPALPTVHRKAAKLMQMLHQLSVFFSGKAFRPARWAQCPRTRSAACAPRGAWSTPPCSAPPPWPSRRRWRRCESCGGGWRRVQVGRKTQLHSFSTPSLCSESTGVATSVACCAPAL